MSYHKKNYIPKLNLTQQINEHIVKPRFSLSRGIHFYPSEASVRYNDRGIEKTMGSCLRKSYLRCTGAKGIYRPDSYLMWMALQGRMMEDIITEQLKDMGLLVSNSVRFYNAEYNISGEVDIVVKDPKTEEVVVVEAKGWHGYMAKKHMMGDRQNIGRPKDNHLLQLLIYLKLHPNTFDYGKLFYKARDTADIAEFDVTLFDRNGRTVHTVNGEEDNRFSVDDVLDRYKYLGNCVRDQKIPEKDYKLVYSPEEVELYHQRGEISDSKYKKYKDKKERLGDFWCRSCPFLSTHCYNRLGNPI